MEQPTKIEPLVGQPFRLGANEVAVFQSSNKWTVYYKAYPHGRWLHMPRLEWDRLATPVSIDPSILSSNHELDRHQYLPIGLCVSHDDYGMGYVTCHKHGHFEVCFESIGPKILSFRADWEKMTPHPGIGERWSPPAGKVGSLNSRNHRRNMGAVPLEMASGQSTELGTPAPSNPPVEESEARSKRIQGVPSGRQDQSQAQADGFTPRLAAPSPGLRAPGERRCRCAGSNENCFRCHGTGRLQAFDNATSVFAPTAFRDSPIPAKPISPFRPPTPPPPAAVRRATGMLRCPYCAALVKATKWRSHQRKCRT